MQLNQILSPSFKSCELLYFFRLTKAVWQAVDGFGSPTLRGCSHKISKSRGTKGIHINRSTTTSRNHYTQTLAVDLPRHCHRDCFPIWTGHRLVVTSSDKTCDMREYLWFSLSEHRFIITSLFLSDDHLNIDNVKSNQ